MLVSPYTPIHTPSPDAEQSQQPWRDAIADPAVWDRLQFHAGMIGHCPPAALLVALLDCWDHMEHREKDRRILNTLGFEPAAAYVWQAKHCEALRARENR